jgi:hypothetical protein
VAARMGCHSAIVLLSKHPAMQRTDYDRRTTLHYGQNRYGHWSVRAIASCACGEA